MTPSSRSTGRVFLSCGGGQIYRRCATLGSSTGAPANNLRFRGAGGFPLL
ncbi:hypothetical protein BDA96_05G125200 [Sorghum bicolor]|uniref:Uncharacterized protein n=1 Tax=Sorghum bicolor TaxID=4558 RepID=A0A921QZQ3_SORBI|nr:hypothetical protein BDA96_05G125200 [Sorghum bicolor]